MPPPPCIYPRRSVASPFLSFPVSFPRPFLLSTLHGGLVGSVFAILIDTHGWKGSPMLLLSCLSSQ